MIKRVVITLLSLFILIGCSTTNKEKNINLIDISTIREIVDLEEGSVILFAKSSCLACQSTKHFLNESNIKIDKPIYVLDFDKLPYPLVELISTEYKIDRVPVFMKKLDIANEYLYASEYLENRELVNKLVEFMK